MTQTVMIVSLILIILFVIVGYVYHMHHIKPEPPKPQQEYLIDPYTFGPQNTKHVTFLPHEENFSQDIKLGFNEDGSENIERPAVWNRFIYANKGSRLKMLGDPIRGDLPIVPKTGEWFSPAATPRQDLKFGAVHAIAGYDNENSKKLYDLMYNTS